MGDPSQPDRRRQRGLYAAGRGYRGRAAGDRGDGRGPAREKGAATLDGRMIDIASIRQAEVVVRKADLIAQCVKA